ncbi:MAG: hypothetical protein CBE00_02350 [Planctomycetaceae bacterium TMED240]|nr:hypothetical protein [Rhodopirellula sp.]OUX08240.1 MAG: hypothetical protein CBE00_02350 [Planctomycetaceae bacterium TMED240]
MDGILRAVPSGRVRLAVLRVIAIIDGGGVVGLPRSVCPPRPQSFAFLTIWPTATVNFPWFVSKGGTESLAIFGSLGIMILVTIVPLMMVRWF